MTELLRPSLYGAFHRIAPVVRADRPEVGDLYAVLDAGAYGFVMASSYNRRPLPAEVLVDGSEWRIVRRRQTVEELLAPEIDV